MHLCHTTHGWCVPVDETIAREKRLIITRQTGFNFLSHGSQDLYPTYLKDTKGFDNYHAIVATIIGNCGAITCVSQSYCPR
jgi:hypothetical protein